MPAERFRRTSTEPPYQIAKDIVDYLKRSKATLAVAESVTGGGIMAALTAVEGCSSIFRGGVVAYATPVKEELLKVDKDLLDDEGPVHVDVAAQMAEGVHRVTSTWNEGHTAWGLGITGVAGPESQGKPEVGTVYIGVAGPDGERQGFGPFNFPGNRERVREWAVHEALAVLRTELRRARGEGIPPYTQCCC